LTGIIYDYLTVGIQNAPTGEIVGFKKVNDVIIVLLIPSAARRSCATTRKMRAEFAIDVSHSDGSTEIINDNYEKTIYRVGETIYPDSWDCDRWNECSHGIHFFLTREEAESYN
jgi:hypothetical protein